jgi:hypothetical protein
MTFDMRIFWLSAILLAGSPAFAQVDTGAILGHVTDPTGAVVPAAKVTVASEDTGLALNSTSNEKGEYTFSPLRIGSYSVSVEHPGFAKSTRVHVRVDIQQQVLLDVQLQPGQVEQSIDVSSAAELLQTQNASVGQVVQSRAINDLPLNGRNYVFLAQLSAGVTYGQKDSRGEDSNGRFAANGTRPTQNNYLLDGIDNNSSIISRQNGKDFVVLTPVDGLAEFKVQTNNYSAEFGRAAGAVLNATVKAGANDFHGDAWEFIRNNDLDAADFFTNAAGQHLNEYRRNQFGFTQGGPVWIPKLYNGHDKTFFFFDYEGTRIRQGHPDVSTVPTSTEAQSGYTNFQDLISGQTGSRTDALNRSYPSGAIFDPATTRASGTSFVRDPFANNIIPASRLDPNAVKLLQLLPLPNGPGILNNYTNAPIFADDSNNFDIRIDQVFGQHDQMFGRYSYSFLHRIHPGPFTGYADGSDSLVNSNLDDRSQNGVISETHLFSPTLVNEVRVGVNREHALWLQPYGTTYGIPQQFGIQGVPQTFENGGLPEFTVGALTRFGSYGFVPSSKYGTTPQITDDVTWTRGSHTIKAGFMAQRILFPFAQPPQSRGLMNFSGVFTSIVNKTDASTAVAQFLLSPTADSNIAGANTVQLSNFHTHDLRRNYLGSYIQDDWKVTRKLTINAGLRWDFFGYEYDKFGDNANFAPNAGFAGGTFFVPSTRINLVPASYTATLAKDGITVKPTGLLPGQSQKKNFAPRFGFAWQALDRLVVRGGYGLFYGGAEEIGGSPLLTENFPFEYTVTRTALTPQTPITADNSIGLLESSFQNLSIDPATVNVAGLSLIGFQYNWKTMYTQSFNLMLQYQLTGSSTLSVGYVGSTARHIPVAINSNPVLELLPPGVNQTPYVPYPDTAISGGDYTGSIASSNYNSLQTTLEKRFSGGLSLLANFTWAKTLTDARDPLEGDIGGYRAPWLSGFGITHDFALADFDVRLALHISGIYELPFGAGRRYDANANRFLRGVAGGWSVNFILSVQDGQPFTVGCPAATSTGFGCNALMVAGQNPYAGSSVAHFINASAFAQPSTVTAIGQTDFSPLGGAATQVTGPPFRRLDLSLFKQFHVTERAYFELRAEAFNISNTPNFANPSNLNLVNTSNFGGITATRDNPNDPRELQFGLKLYW